MIPDIRTVVSTILDCSCDQTSRERETLIKALEYRERAVLQRQQVDHMMQEVARVDSLRREAAEAAGRG